MLLDELGDGVELVNEAIEITIEGNDAVLDRYALPAGER